MKETPDISHKIEETVEDKKEEAPEDELNEE